jgi:hypothetical protein
MLTFESPIYEEEGVVVFRDHADPTLFHYLAGPPRLTRDASGRPNLLLLKYRHALEVLAGPSPPARDALGGGFLMFGVDCGLDTATKGSIESAMQSRVPPGAGAAKLVPVLYTEGTVRVLALDHETGAEAGEGAGAAPRTGFVKKVLGTSVPSLMQDQRAIFALELTVDGVTLLEEAFESELSPIGVIYDLKFAGLRPALAVKAHVDMNRVYEKLEAKFGVSVPLSGGGSGGGSSEGAGGEASAEREDQSEPAASGASGTETGQSGQAGSGGKVKIEIGFAIEDLRETSAIDIEIIRQQAGEDVGQMEQRALELLKESILNNFFRPVMSQQPVDPQAAAQQLQQATSQGVNRGSSGGGGQVEIGFEFRYQRKEELKTADFDYRVQAPETRTHAPNGFFAALVGGGEKAKHIRTVDLDDEFFKRLQVQVSTTADFMALGLAALVVEMAYGPERAPTVEGAFTLRPEAPTSERVFQAFLDQGDGSYRYRLDYKFGDSDDTAAAEESLTVDWQRSRSRVLVVHPPDHLDLLRVLLEPARIDWAVVSRIDAVVRYRDPRGGFEARRTFSFIDGSAAEDWTVRLPEGAPARYTVQQTWHLAAGNKIEGPEVEAIERRFFVNDPFADRLPITVDPQVDAADVLRVMVDLRYQDADNGLDIHRNVELVGPEYRAETVQIPVIDPEKRRYTFRVRLVKQGGQTEEREAQTTDALTIVVTPGGFYMDVQVALLGTLESQELTAVQVDMKTEPLDGQAEKVESHLFMPTDPVRMTQRLLMRADRTAGFQYRVQLFHADGRVSEREWTRHESRILPLSLAALVVP